MWGIALVAVPGSIANTRWHFTSFQDLCDVVVRAVRVGKHKPNQISKFRILTR
jgi:hypothetical protein